MKKRNLFKLAALTAVFALGSMFANAQNTSTTTPPAQQGAAAIPSLNGGSIKVIDNKGTVKYLQVQNGITQVTTAGTGGVVTTWQLGGTLTDNTYINSTGQIFALDGIKIVPTGLNASTNATEQSTHLNATGTGWTLLVRNEATGEIMKMKATDMVQSGWQVFKVTASGTPVVIDVTYSVTGIDLSTYQTTYVYRNGAKLVAGIDYDIDGSNIVLKPNADGSQASTSSWADETFTLYVGDVIEVQFIK